MAGLVLDRQRFIPLLRRGTRMRSGAGPARAGAWYTCCRNIPGAARKASSWTNSSVDLWLKRPSASGMVVVSSAQRTWYASGDEHRSTPRTRSIDTKHYNSVPAVTGRTAIRRSWRIQGGYDRTIRRGAWGQVKTLTYSIVVAVFLIAIGAAARATAAQHLAAGMAVGQRFVAYSSVTTLSC